MPGPYSTFDRATCDVPGTRLQHYYWPHASGLCHLAVWRPAASFQAAPVYVVVHGGFGYSPGWRSMTTASMTPGKQKDLATVLSAKGWVIVSIDYPACSVNLHDEGAGTNKFLGQWAEIHPVAMWPEQAAYLALAVQYLKTHWSGVAGPDSTPFGATLWGAGNSIDPSNIHLQGISWGAAMAMYVALQPDGYYPYEPGGWHDMDAYTPRASHRVRSAGGVSPQFDMTQFYIDTGYTSPIGSIYQGDFAQMFMRRASTRTWSGLSNHWKRQSPYWLLQEKHIANSNVSFFIEYLGSGSGDAAWDGNLTADDFSPGTVRNDVAGGKAWIDPHDGRFQGRPTRDELAAYGDLAGTPIRKSVVRWAGGSAESAAPFGHTDTTTSAYITNWLAWAKSVGYPTAYTV